MAKLRKTFKIGGSTYKLGDIVEVKAYNGTDYYTVQGKITYILRADTKPSKKDLIELYGDNITGSIKDSVSESSKRNRIRVETANDKQGHLVIPIISENHISLLRREKEVKETLVENTIKKESVEVVEETKSNKLEPIKASELQKMIEEG